MSEQTLTLIDNTVVTLGEQLDSFDLIKIARRLSGDLRALILVYNSPETAVPAVLKTTLKKLQTKVKLDISSLEEKSGKYFLLLYIFPKYRWFLLKLFTDFSFQYLTGKNYKCSPWLPWIRILEKNIKIVETFTYIKRRELLYKKRIFLRYRAADLLTQRNFYNPFPYSSYSLDCKMCQNISQYSMRVL